LNDILRWLKPAVSLRPSNACNFLWFDERKKLKRKKEEKRKRKKKE